MKFAVVVFDVVVVFVFFVGGGGKVGYPCNKHSLARLMGENLQDLVAKKATL